MDDESGLNAIPNITSFILRFVQDGHAASGQSALRGVVRCIQTDEEIAFTRWEDAVAFISRFVPLESDFKEE
jgi:hypothetical protein